MDFTREVKDTLQICINGHEITHFYNYSPDSRKKFCPICGKTTIISCDNCDELITGGTVTIRGLTIEDPSGESIDYSPGIRPEYCEHCGLPFPWTSQETDIISQITEEKIDTSTNKNEVFIVHGHNTEVKNQIEEYILEIGLSPIILHKQPNLGKTLIEKVEHYAEPVQFAIIILTGDDYGGSLDGGAIIPIVKKEGILKPATTQIAQGRIMSRQKLRARQNVIFEFGYFIGRLSRKKVAAIYEEGVELPSDIDGFVYIPYDKHGNWKNALKREIQASGIALSRPDTNL